MDPLFSLDSLSAPAIQKISSSTIFAACQVQIDFDFNASGDRARQRKERTALDDSRLYEEILYLGSYERETHKTRTAGSGTYYQDRIVHRHSIGGFAVYTRTEKPGLRDEIRLTTLIKDHLGSTDVLYSKTWNDTTFAGGTTESQSFDPWGERRASDTLVNFRTTDTTPFRTSGLDYDRGYTGHEQLDDSGLIHMNGRIYDPELGRMLSPDPYVQVPEYSQNFNRYSYVMNNPLNLTDPSGFSWLGDAFFHDIGGWLKENWRTVAVIAVVAVASWGAGTFLMGGVGTTLSGSPFAVISVDGVTSLTPAGMATVGATAGGVGGGLNAALGGGDLSDISRGATVGAIQGAISGGLLHGLHDGIGYENAFLHIAGHGVVGGASNAAMGGKFQDGFPSAAAGGGPDHLGIYSGMSGNDVGARAARTTIAGIVGGTASSLGGGKFANGAWTSSFQHYLNMEFGKNSDPYSPNYGKTDSMAEVNMGQPTDPTFSIGVIYVESVAAGGLFRLTGLAIHTGFARLLGPTQGRIFLTGGNAAKLEAQVLARSQGGMTLEMTIPGRILDKITTPKTFSYVKPAWNFMSGKFSQSAVGPVKSVQPLTTGISIDTVWATREYPVPFMKGNPINYHSFP